MKPVLVLLLAMAVGLGVMYFAMKRIFPHQANLPFNLRRSDPSRDEPWSQTAAPASPWPVPEALPAALRPAGDPAAPAVTEATAEVPAGARAVPAPGDRRSTEDQPEAPRGGSSGSRSATTAPASEQAAGGAPDDAAREPAAGSPDQTAGPGLEGDAQSPRQAIAGAAAPPARPGPAQGLEPFPAEPRRGPPLPPAPRGAADRLPSYHPPNDLAVIQSPIQAQVQNVVTQAIQASASEKTMGAYLAQTSGLAPEVALAWVKKENGVNNDILGVTNQNGLEKFATWQQGIDAAVNLLQTSNYYAGIRAAIAGGNPCAQRDAIVASPWSGRSHYGNGANFPEIPGCPPYGQ